MANQGDGSRWTRRDVIGALEVSTALGVATELWRNREVLAGSLPQAGSQTLSLPPGAIIRTVVKDVDAGVISGVTLFHEHLGNGRRPGPRGGGPASPDIPPAKPAQDVDWMTIELKAAK